jgi:hypothetical protein
MNQRVKQQRFLKYLWLLHTPKKVNIGPRRPNSGTDQKGPDPTGSATLVVRGGEVHLFSMAYTV